MDSISSKQNRRLIFKSKRFNNKKIDNKDLRMKDIALLAYIEGDFSIFYKNKPYFQDSYMCLLELGVQLVRWLNLKNDFCYHAVTSEDADILCFKRREDTSYTISSSWISTEPLIVSAKELFESVFNYISDLDVMMNREFNIHITDFL